MTSEIHIIFTSSFSFILILLKYLLKGKSDPLTYLMMFYYFFTFGPVINYLLGVPIYFGTPVEYIPTATNIFTTAIISMFVMGIVISPNIKKDEIHNKNDYSFLKIVFILFSLYALIQTLYILFFSFGGSKIDKIALLTPRIHYNYLMIQVYLVSFHFLIKNKKLYWINFSLYIFYCLITGERDFIFPLFAIGMHIFIYKNISRKKKVFLFFGGISFFFLATLIFLLRDSTQGSNSILGSILNQGSLLFINSYTVKLLNDSYEFFNGMTYINSIQNLLPSWIYKTDFNTLDWFKENYAPKSTSGYGFGLDAEGYMNFGYIGVSLTFIFISIIQRISSRNFMSSDFFKFYSVFYISFSMYSFRNDSLAFFKGNLYAVIFFSLIFLLSNILNSTGHKQT